MASITLSADRLDRRNRRINRQGLPHWDASSRIDARVVRQKSTLDNTALNIIRYLMKLTLIALISVGFLYCASTILATSTNIPVKAIALAFWSCGFVPISYYLWNS